MNKIHKIEIPFDQEISFSGKLKKQLSVDNEFNGQLKFEHRKLAGKITVEGELVTVKVRIHSLEKVALIKLKKLISEYEKENGLIDE